VNDRSPITTFRGRYEASEILQADPKAQPVRFVEIKRGCCDRVDHRARFAAAAAEKAGRRKIGS
jgi:hypothetical protein